MLGHDLLALRDRRHDRLAHHRFEQRFLVLEVEVDRPFGDAGMAGHFLELRRLVAPLDEDLERRRDDLGRPRRLAALPPRLRLALRRDDGVGHGKPPE